MGKYRGLNITGGLNANFRKIKVRKTVDTESLQDRGTIAEAASDLPTRGAAHRRGRGALKSQRKAATGATRGSISMGWITGDDSNVIDEHDYGYIFQNTEANDRAAWEQRRALGVAASIADEQSANAQQVSYAEGVSLYNSTAIIPAGTPLILNTDGTVSAVAGVSGGLDIPGMSTTPTITMLNPNSNTTSTDDDFAGSMDMNSTHMAIGAMAEESSSGDTNSGVVYVYDISDGSLVTTIQNPNVHGSAANDNFGDLVIKMSDSYLAVVAYGERYYHNASNPDLSGGSRVYIFDTTNWELQYTLSNHLPDGDTETDQFGTHFDITDTHVIVGARRVNESSSVKESGKAYVYDVTDGTLLYTFDNPNPVGSAQSDWFGNKVSLSSTHAFVTSLEDGDELGFSGNRYYSGKVFVYDLSNGSLVHTIDNPDPDGTGADQFGDYVVTNETKIAISSVLESSNSGKVYVYDSSTYNLLYTIDNPNSQGTAAGDSFGRIDMNDTHIVAGAPGNEGSGGELYAGTVYVFNVADGSLEKTIEYPGTIPENYEMFGSIVAINGTHIAAGGKNISDPNSNTGNGAIYLYQAGTPESTNLTADNYIGFAKDDFGSAGSLGRVVSIGGTIGGFTGLTIGADYWIQNDGSVSTTETDFYAGEAISATEIQLKYATGTWQGERGVFLNSGQYVNFSSLGSATNFPVSIGGPSDVVNSGFSDGTTVFGSSYSSFGTYANMVTLSTAEPMVESTSYGRQNRGITAVGNGITGFSAAGAGYDYNSRDYEWTDRTNNIYAINMVTKVGGAVTGTLRTTPYAMTGNNNTTRAFFSGGSYGSTSVQALTFETGGDSSYFGHTLGLLRRWAAGAGNEDKAFILGGYMTTQTGGALNSTEGFDTQTAGNSVSLGSLTVQREGNVSISDGTYIITAGGANTYGYGRTSYLSADRLNISTAGTAEDFGDLGSSQYKSAGASGNSA